MKKLLAILLLVSMLVTLAACGDGKKDAIVSEQPSSFDGRSDGPQTPSGDAETGILGHYTESTRTYVNNFAGIGCQLPADWEVFDEEQLAKLNGMVAGLVDDEAIADLLKNNGNASIFYAQKDAGRSTINIGITELGALGGANEQQYVAQSIDLVAPVLESMGMTNVTVQAGTVSFAGGEHAAIFVKASIQGVAFYETQVCMVTGNYMAVITAGCSSADGTMDTLSMFYGL